MSKRKAALAKALERNIEYVTYLEKVALPQIEHDQECILHHLRTMEYQKMLQALSEAKEQVPLTKTSNTLSLCTPQDQNIVFRSLSNAKIKAGCYFSIPPSKRVTQRLTPEPHAETVEFLTSPDHAEQRDQIQKYRALEQKNNTGTSPWKAREIQALEKLVKLNPEEWPRLFSEDKILAPFTLAQCQFQLSKAKMPPIKTAWTKEEDEIIRHAVEVEKCTDLKVIASRFDPQVHPMDCLQRYQQKMNHHNLTKSEWSEQDDENLLQAVEILGKHDWNAIADCIDGKIADQCNRRFMYTLDPNLRTGKWSVIEDRRLALAVYAYGGVEAVIGNSSSSSSSSAEPPSKKIEWALVQYHLPGRTDAQCRERWMYCHHPQLTKSKWTSDEDQKLAQLVEQHGIGQWAQIAKGMTHRSRNQVYRRWRTCFPQKWEDYQEQQAQQKRLKTS